MSQRVHYWIQQYTDQEFEQFVQNSDGYFIDSLLDIDLEVEVNDVIIVYIQNSGFIGYGRVQSMGRYYEIDFHFTKAIDIKMETKEEKRLYPCDDEDIICHIDPHYNFIKWVQEKVNYWVYVINQKRLDEFVQHGETHMGSYTPDHIYYDDIIIMITREQKVTRFHGLYKAAKPCQKRNIKVFSDNNLNRYIVPLKTSHIFDEPIKIGVVDRIDSEASGLRNSDNFRRRHMAGDMTFSLVHKDAAKLVSKLLETEIENFQKKKPVSPPPSDDSESSEEDPEEEPTDDAEEESPDDDATENSDAEESEDANPGNIPVMITPCHKFYLPIEEPEKYLMEHLIECNSCVITDNNKFCVSAIFDKATVEIVDVIEDNNAYFHLPLEDYWAMKGHEPIAPTAKYFIRAAHMLNPTDLYYDCFLLTWTETGDEEE